MADKRKAAASGDSVPRCGDATTVAHRSVNAGGVYSVLRFTSAKQSISRVEWGRKKGKRGRRRSQCSNGGETDSGAWGGRRSEKLGGTVIAITAFRGAFPRLQAAACRAAAGRWFLLSDAQNHKQSVRDVGIFLCFRWSRMFGLPRIFHRMVQVPNASQTTFSFCPIFDINTALIRAVFLNASTS
jgi:hypothetical protein